MTSIQGQAPKTPTATEEVVFTRYRESRISRPYSPKGEER